MTKRAFPAHTPSQPAPLEVCAPLAQEAGSFCKGNTRPFLEKGTSRWNVLLGFLHPGSRASRSPGQARAPAAGRRKLTFATSRGKGEARDQAKPASAYSSRGSPGGCGGDFRRFTGSFALHGLGKGTGRAPGAVGRPLLRGTEARSGQEGSPRGAASALTSGKKLSIVPARSPTCPSRVSSSKKSAQRKVRGRNHACHGATPRNSSPRGSPVAIA